ncbi:MAG: MarR family transcriptional regulator [Candidatus Baldrarchaeia archaeon]
MSLDEKAYEIIKAAGKEGILQSELWKKLGISSREGARIVSRLEKRGLIERKRVIHNGRRTYRVFALIKEESQIQWDTLEGCPCFTCHDLYRCGSGNPLSPELCEKMTKWLMKLVDKFKDSETS